MRKIPTRYNPRKRRGMYAEQFGFLEAGDLIRGSKPNGAYRKILAVSKHEKRTFAITLEKIRPSRFRNPNTVYCSGDAGFFVPVKVKNRKIWEWNHERVVSKRRKAYIAAHKKKAEYHTRRLKDALRAVRRSVPI